MNQTAEQELRAMQFIAAFTEFQEEAAAINQKNGFSTDDPLIDEFEQWFKSVTETETGYVLSMTRDKFQPLFASFRNARVGLKLALITGEVSETLEAVRKNLGYDEHCPEFTAEEIEIADAHIRLMNYGVDRKLRIAQALVAKQEYNRNRPDHSKEARSSEHGKKF